MLEKQEESSSMITFDLLEQSLETSVFWVPSAGKSRHQIVW